MVHLRTGAYGIFNATITERHTAVPRLLETLNMEVSQIMKGGYDTFMQARHKEKTSGVGHNDVLDAATASEAWGMVRTLGSRVRLGASCEYIQSRWRA